MIEVEDKSVRTASAQRTFLIDGNVTTATTHRTHIIESMVPVAGRTFLDVGAADGYEARALALRGAAMAVAVEGKDSLYEQAVRAADELGLGTHKVVQADLRRIDQYGLGQFDCACCFGVLYHMSNPFNVLKRLAHMTSDVLLLETHIAPDNWAEGRLLPKHRDALLPGVETVFLDGVPFEGRVCPHRGSNKTSKGSLDEAWTFWLTANSLVKALTRSGFEIQQWFHEIDDQMPEPVMRFGRELGFGHANTKVFVVAKVVPDRRQPSHGGTISSEGQGVLSPRFEETALHRARFLARRILRRLTTAR